VERSAELVIAVMGLVFSGGGTPKTIWDWWCARRSQDVKVKVLLDDGPRLICRVWISSSWSLSSSDERNWK
jgi:hypothetical protein